MLAPCYLNRARFDYGTPHGCRFFLDLGAAANAIKYFGDTVPPWNDHMQHGTYDKYWQSRNVSKDLGGVRHPVLIVAGWFDAAFTAPRRRPSPASRSRSACSSGQRCRQSEARVRRAVPTARRRSGAPRRMRSSDSVIRSRDLAR